MFLLLKFLFLLSHVYFHQRFPTTHDKIKCHVKLRNISYYEKYWVCFIHIVCPGHRGMQHSSVLSSRSQMDQVRYLAEPPSPDSECDGNNPDQHQHLGNSKQVFGLLTSDASKTKWLLLPWTLCWGSSSVPQNAMNSGVMSCLQQICQGHITIVVG